MPRFFVPTEQCSEAEVIIRGDDARHIARSLRMAVGDGAVACDGEGRVFEGTLSYIRDEEVRLAVHSVSEGAGESPVHITLLMAYPKGDKLEVVVQKAVELGAAEIVPFVSSRCVKVPREDKEDARRERLQRIATEAAKQCGRSRLPTVGHTLSFADAVRRGAEAELSLLCYEGEHTLSLRRALSGVARPRTVAVMIGSEGGFSPEEAEAAREAGFLGVHLGERILRCETAPACVLSALSYEWELS